MYLRFRIKNINFNFVSFLHIEMMWVDNIVLHGIQEPVHSTVYHAMIKGLRLVLEGFVVPMQEGACETGSQIPKALARGI